VGLHASIELGADKLICLHLNDVTDMDLPQWLPLSQARQMLLQRLMGHVSTAVSSSSSGSSSWSFGIQCLTGSG
jgi:amino-acid N-acetyltransferase